MSEHERGEVVICRACISECLEYKSLYKQGLILGEVTTLATLLKFCTNLDFDAEDLLPAHMCSRCVQNLAKSYVFKKTVLEANELLRKQHSEFCGSNNSDLIVDGDADDVSDSQQYVEDVGAEELQWITMLSDESLNEEAVTLGTSNDENIETLETDLGEETFMQDIIESTENHSTCNDNYLTEVETLANVNTDADTTSKENNAMNTFEAVNGYVTEVEEEQQLQEVADDTMEQNRNSADNSSAHAVLANRAATKRCAPSETQNQQQHQQSRSQTQPPKSKVSRVHNKSNKQKSANHNIQCKICGKQLNNDNSFKCNMQLRSAHKPDLCSSCGKNLKMANMIHIRDNSTTCEICGKSFDLAMKLRAHMRLHLGDKSYRCEVCGLSFLFSRCLNTHTLWIHNFVKLNTEQFIRVMRNGLPPPI